MIYKSYYYNRDKKYYGASLIKVLDAIYLYDKNKVTNELKPYIKTALSYSNNDSHIYLVNYINRNKLRNYGLSIGAKYPLEPGYDYYANTIVDDQIKNLNPDVYILDRDDNTSFYMYKLQSVKTNEVAIVFPFFFYYI